MFNINNFDDPEVWDLICDGDTKGVFQLESNLGKKWARESQPRNIKELAALISLIRPGTLLAKHKSGRSMTEVYCFRKAGKTDFPVEYEHESLEPILKETYGVLVYQEQAMQIAQRLAGFNLKEADGLRKAIGKKKADLMEKVKKAFITGAENEGIVTQKVAEAIFSWIEKSSRYSFNKCLSPKTVVITENGEKLLDELEVGDMVLAPKNETEDEFVEVLDVIDNGVKEVVEVTIEGERKITCTLDHKFLCKDGEKRPLYEILAQDLEIMCID
jgi:DNA polymerase-3 subunit alpha